MASPLAASTDGEHAHADERDQAKPDNQLDLDLSSEASPRSGASPSATQPLQQSPVRVRQPLRRVVAHHAILSRCISIRSSVGTAGTVVGAVTASVDGLGSASVVGNSGGVYGGVFDTVPETISLADLPYYGYDSFMGATIRTGQWLVVYSKATQTLQGRVDVRIA